MIFNFFVSPEHEKFFAERFNDGDKQKSIFFYVAGSAEALRQKFGQTFSADGDKDGDKAQIPEAMSKAERALLNIAFELYNKDHSCNFVDNFLLLDPQRRRVVIEALAQIGGAD